MSLIPEDIQVVLANLRDGASVTDDEFARVLDYVQKNPADEGIGEILDMIVGTMSSKFGREEMDPRLGE